MSDLTERSNRIFKGLCNKKLIIEKEFSFKNACCLGKIYLLPKIHKILFDVPGRPIISNCGTPTEKFLDHHLQPFMKGGSYYVKHAQDFLDKPKHQGNVPSNAILVKADVVGPYPSIPHEAGLKHVYEKLEERVEKKIPSSDLVNMTEFVLKNNYLEFDSKLKKQISGTAIGTKFAPPYACIFMDKVGREFLEAEGIKSWVWLRYLDDILFIWTEGENKRLNIFHLNVKFSHEKSKTSVNFLNVAVRINGDKSEINLL